MVCPMMGLEVFVPEAPVQGPSPLEPVTVQERTFLALHVTVTVLLLWTKVGLTIHVTMSAGGGGRQRPAEQPAESGKLQLEGLPIGVPVQLLTMVLPLHKGTGLHVATQVVPCKV